VSDDDGSSCPAVRLGARDRRGRLRHGSLPGDRRVSGAPLGCDAAGEADGVPPRSLTPAVLDVGDAKRQADIGMQHSSLLGNRCLSVGNRSRAETHRRIQGADGVGTAVRLDAILEP
jgi:hypothetical protein